MVALPTAPFIYQHTQPALNSETYREFLEDHLRPKYYKKSQRIYLIQDNASYHKKPETYEWFRKNRKYIEVYNLPPYSPELNAEERLWHYTRMCATHNRYYDTQEELCAKRFATFQSMQENPNFIEGIIRSFF